MRSSSGAGGRGGGPLHPSGEGADPAALQAGGESRPERFPVPQEALPQRSRVSATPHTTVGFLLPSLGLPHPPQSPCERVTPVAFCLLLIRMISALISWSHGPEPKRQTLELHSKLLPLKKKNLKKSPEKPAHVHAGAARRPPVPARREHVGPGEQKNTGGAKESSNYESLRYRKRNEAALFT